RAASAPSATEATTFISGRRPSRSSSASRKTSLSSTRTMRIWSLTALTLFSREEELVVRLAALVEVDLELGVPRAQFVEEAVQLGSAVAGEQREDIARLSEQRVGDRTRDLGQARAGCDRAIVEETEVFAFLHGEPVDLGIAGGGRDLTRRDALDGPAHLLDVLLG